MDDKKHDEFVVKVSGLAERMNLTEGELRWGLYDLTDLCRARAIKNWIKKTEPDIPGIGEN